MSTPHASRPMPAATPVPQPGATTASWVVVLGATSRIARGVAGALAVRGYRMLLAGRDADELDRVAADLRIKHRATVATVRYDAADALDADALASFVAEIQVLTAGELAGVVAAVGALGDADRAATEGRHAIQLLQTNFVGPAAVLTELATLLARRGAGFIIGIASVAGDRGRQSNFVYGSAKGGFALWLQGLRNRLWPAGVRVITVKPGFVDTEMTFGRPGLFAVADPARVGASIVRALDGRRDVIYVPWFWRFIMWCIRMIPEPVFKRMRL